MTLNQNGLDIHNVRDLQMLLVNAGGGSVIGDYQITDRENARGLIDAFVEAGSEIATTVKKYGYRISDKQAWAIAFGAIEHGLIQID